MLEFFFLFFKWDASLNFQDRSSFSVHLLLDPKLYSKLLRVSSFHRCLLVKVHPCLYTHIKTQIFAICTGNSLSD